MRALVVDDSAAIRRMQQKELESLGWEVDTAAHGEQALEFLGTMTEYALMLTDWHMPGMDGLELCKAVRRDGRYGKLRIIVITSDAVLESVQRALDAGANDFLMKPFSPEALSERIDQVLEEVADG